MKMKLKPGDKVMLVEQTRDFEREAKERKENGRTYGTTRWKEEATVVEIAKVGTKYAYVGGDHVGSRQRKFALEGGKECGGWNSSLTGRIFTKEGLAEHEARKAAIERAKKFTRYENGGMIEIEVRCLTTEGITALSELLEGDIYQ